MGRKTNPAAMKLKPVEAKPRRTSQPASTVGRPKFKVASKAKPWTEAEIEEAFRRLRAANPEPRGELQYINPYTLLVAVVLSAQATSSVCCAAT